jgi:hypothetical protein
MSHSVGRRSWHICCGAKVILSRLYWNANWRPRINLRSPVIVSRTRCRMAARSAPSAAPRKRGGSAHPRASRRRRVDRRADRAEARRRRLAGLAARADEQHWLVLQGDERGVCGEYPPSEFQPAPM